MEMRTWQTQLEDADIYNEPAFDTLSQNTICLGRHNKQVSFQDRDLDWREKISSGLSWE